MNALAKISSIQELDSDSVASLHSFDVAVLILPGFSHLALHAYIEPLRLANSVSGTQLFRWRMAGLSMEPVLGANGIRVSVDTSAEALIQPRAGNLRAQELVIVAADQVQSQLYSELQSILRCIASTEGP